MVLKPKPLKSPRARFFWQAQFYTLLSKIGLVRGTRQVAPAEAAEGAEERKDTGGEEEEEEEEAPRTPGASEPRVSLEVAEHDELVQQLFVALADGGPSVPFRRFAALMIDDVR